MSSFRGVFLPPPAVEDETETTVAEMRETVRLHLLDEILQELIDDGSITVEVDDCGMPRFRRQP